MTTFLKQHKQYIQLIHIAKSQLRIDNDVHQMNCLHFSGQRTNSTTQMTRLELANYLEHLKNLGFKPTSKKRTGNKPAGFYSPKGRGTVHDKLRSVWFEMCDAGFIHSRSEEAIFNYTWNQLKADWPEKVAVPRTLNNIPTKCIHPVINRLKKWKARCVKEAANG
ncbi:phage protein GemA/Gp16 family protein [Catenovulum sediminis]|uniref:Phage protein GemA/Gp16 family protein n=1 Tax=Catenovulum sediminis TaxID=1740262 RepID=A0ABV1RCL2_9ALTE